MAYDQDLARRVHTLTEKYPQMVEKKMFGGVGFILHGNMACGVVGEDLLVRVGEEKNAQALAQPYTKPFLAPGGKPMAGWILVSAAGTGSDESLRQWVEQGYEYALSLPAKK